jgi:hypothetical protein
MNSGRRYIDAAVFTLAWIGAGCAFHLDPYAYLILGVPLVALFQVLVRRQSLQKLWARDAESFRLDVSGITLAAGMMVVPGYELFAGAAAAPWLCPLRFMLFSTPIAMLSSLEMM